MAPKRKRDTSDALQIVQPVLPIKKIPSHVWEFIFEFFDVKTLGRLAQVCKYFQARSETNYLWNRLLQREFVLTGYMKCPICNNATTVLSKLAFLAHLVTHDGWKRPQLLAIECEARVHIPIKKAAFKLLTDSFRRFEQSTTMYALKLWAESPVSVEEDDLDGMLTFSHRAAWNALYPHVPFVDYVEYICMPA